MPDRPRRPVTRIGLARHRAAAALLRATARLRPAAEPDPRRITFLLLHAWGMGGTIRTVLTTAGELARDHDVEIISLVRRRSKPCFALPPGVTVTVIDDQRPGARRGRHRLLQRLLERWPSALMHPSDHASEWCSMWTDLLLARRLAAVRSGTLIGTRPGVNLVVAGGARRGVRTVGEDHFHLSAYPPALRAEIARRYPALDALVTLTERDAEDYRALLGPEPRILTIPNAVPHAPPEPAALERPVVLAAGRLTRQKGFDRLIEAFALVAPHHPGWELHICGSGPRRRALRRRVAKHGMQDRIRLPGRVSDLDQRLHEASVFALSSRREGFPMVLLEAMSHGLSIVSFDCPTGPQELLDDGRSGLLVAEGDVAAFAAALDRLMADPALRAQYGAAAHATAQRYDATTIAARWRTLLSALHGRAPQPVRSPAPRARVS